MYVIGINSNNVNFKQKRIWENVTRRCVLIDSIFTMSGRLMFSTDSDIYFLSFLVICYLHHIVTIIGINSFRHLFVLSFTLSIPHGVFHTLYADTT
jgi:membrane protein YdbS with pleckstrin-like domain